ncbi:hypothetical protein QUF90_14820 [Desulfococcaceae bacterium HSG9]|nr:hypothetical protein [Desulfococcaceae bacterium HSG9]
MGNQWLRYNDDTGDGLLDGANETGIENVLITLFKDSDGDGTYETEVVGVAADYRTNATGYYEFTVAAGIYRVQETDIVSYNDVTDIDGTDGIDGAAATADDNTVNQIDIKISSQGITRANNTIDGSNNSTGNNFLDELTNDPPENTVPGAQSTTEGTQTAIGGLSVTDTNGNLSTSQLTVTGGVINVDLRGGATISAGTNGTADLTLSGTEAQIQAALATVQYTSDNGTTADILTILSTDAAGLTDTDTVAITVNDPPVIGVAKQASATTNHGDGTYTTTITLLVENLGNVTLSNLQVTDDLTGVFPSIVSVTGLTSNLTVNNKYDGGDTDADLLAAGQTLAVGQSETITFNVRFDAQTQPGPFNNQATASGESPTAVTVTDPSDNGNDPDPNGNGDPDDANEDDPTPITISENPVIGVAKQAGAATNNGDGTYTTTITITLENLGNVVLSNVQVTDDLTTADFIDGTASLTSVTNLSSATLAVNSSYNGDTDTNLLTGVDTLALGETATLTFDVRFNPGSETGPFNNQANGSAQGPGGTPTDDPSDNGTNPDPDGDGEPNDPADENDPTPITFAPSPVIGVAKQASAVVNHGSGQYTTTIMITVENLGNVVLNNVQVTDNVNAIFTDAASLVSVSNLSSATLTVNPAFDGNNNTNLLNGNDTLSIGKTATITFDVRFDPGTETGPFNNQANGSADGPSGIPTSDSSDDGNDPDTDGDNDPNEIGENDPTPIPYTENPIIGVAKQASSAINNGDGSYTTSMTITVENLGNVDFIDVQVTDDLAVTFPTPATFNVTPPTSTLTTNTNFNGVADTALLADGNTLSVGQTASITFNVTFRPSGVSGPFMNSAIATGISPGEASPSDTSDNGTDPDPNGDNNPNEAGENDPTPISYSENPVIGVAKQAGSVINNGDGTHTTTITITVENLGNVLLNNVQVTDDLSSTFAGTNGFNVTAGPTVTAGTITANSGYTGNTPNTNLLAGADTLQVGASATLTFEVTFEPGTAAGPFYNRANASGQSPGGSSTSDLSDNGANPDPDGDSNPNEPDENDPTPIPITENPVIGVAKQAGIVTNNGSGEYKTTITIMVENLGNVTLDDVQITDDLSAAFAGVTSFSITTGPTVTVGTVTANTNFDGNSVGGDTNLLAASQSLAAGAQAVITFEVTFVPGVATGPFYNTAISDGTSPSGGSTSDPSDNGNEPDPDGDSNPNELNENDPTPISISENPIIGIAKQAATVTYNGNGIFRTTITLIVENLGNVALGNVQVTDDLRAVFPTPATFSVTNLNTGAFTQNPAGYNGGNVVNLLSGADTLAVGTRVTITFDVTFNPQGLAGPFFNSATATGTSPNNAKPSDTSDDGTDPDSNGNGDPSEGGENDPTPIMITQNPALILVKTLAGNHDKDSSGTISLNDTLTFTVAMTNTGDTILTTVAVSDPQLTRNTKTCASVPPGGTCMLTGTYVVTQTDADAGQFVNTGTVTDDTICPAAGPGTCESVVTTEIPSNPIPTPPVPMNPGLTLAKALTGNTDQDSSGAVSSGDTLAYTVTMTNTGDVTLTDVVVSDTLITPNSTTCASVAPGATCVLIGDYVATQADVDAGRIMNTGTVSDDVVCPATGSGTCESSVITPIPQNPDLTLAKVMTGNADQDSSGAVSSGDTLAYTVTMTNTGDVTLTDVVVSDTLITPNSITCASVAPGATCVLTGDYVVTQADADAGQIMNTGTVRDDVVCPAAGSGACESSVITPIPKNPDLTLAKAFTGNADQDNSGTVSSGDTLTYTVTMTNTGDVTLTDVVVSDGLLSPNSTTCASVAPGATCVLTGNYVVTLADVDTGQIENTGSVTDDDVCPDAGVAVCEDTVTTLTETVPDSTQIGGADCCLSAESKHVRQPKPTAIIPVSQDIYFITDKAMFASFELDELSRKLGAMPQSGLLNTPEERLKAEYQRVIRKAGRYAHFNLGSFTMRSGLGLDMRQAPDVLAEAVKRKIAPQDVVQARLDRFAKRAGLKTTPQIHPLVLEFYGGSPYYDKDDKGKSRWVDDDIDSTLTPSAWGMTLLRQSIELPGLLTSSDPYQRFIGEVMQWQMNQKVKLIHEQLVSGGDATEKTAYLPHKIKLENVDKSAAPVFGVQDASSHLFDQAAMLWGLANMRRAFTQTGIKSGPELDTLIGIVWQTLETRHFDKNQNTYYIDMTSVFKGAAQGESENSEELPADTVMADKKTLTSYDLMITTLALKSLADETAMPVLSTLARKRLASQMSFLKDNLIDKDGGVFTGYDLTRKAPMPGVKDLLSQAAAIRMLLAGKEVSAWSALFNDKNFDAALKIYQFMEDKLWDDHYGLYRDNTHWRIQSEYTPLNVGTTVGALRELSLRLPEAKRDQILNRMSSFVACVVGKAELQLDEGRDMAADETAALYVDENSGQRPLPVTRRHAANDSTMVKSKGNLTPVLIRKVTLNLFP